MARSGDPVKPVESQSESGEEEDEEFSSEEVDSQESDSEPEQTQTAMQKKSQPQPMPNPPPQNQPPSSSEEEESGSETESDSDGPYSNVRQVTSKPSAPEIVTPTKPVVSKRPSDDTIAKEAKKSKKSVEPETSEKKPNLFQRLWSEEDEIAILKGMIDYSAKNKSDPISDLNAFHDFIKKSLHADFTRTQLQDKIRRLKKKYENNKNKEKNGKERTFAKSHEQIAYDLSKQIWGNENGKENGGEKVVGSPKANGGVAKKTTPKKKANAVESVEVKGVQNAVVVVSGEGDESLPPTKRLNPICSGASIEERMMTKGREMYEMGRGLKGEKEWEKLGVEELELYLKQLEVRVAQTKLVLDAMKSGDH